MLPVPRVSAVAYINTFILTCRNDSNVRNLCAYIACIRYFILFYFSLFHVTKRGWELLRN